MKKIFLCAFALLVTACSGGLAQETQPAPTVWVTPVPVPTVAVADFLPCNAAMIALFQDAEIDPHLSYINGPFDQMGDDPNLLVDQDFVDRQYTQIDDYLPNAIRSANQEGPACLAEYRNLTLEVLGLAHQYWGLVRAGNVKGAVEQVMPVMNEKLEKLLKEVQPALLEEAGVK